MSNRLISPMTWTHLACALVLLLAHSVPDVNGELSFRPQEIANDLGVGYAVRLVDLNYDGKLDIAVVDQRRVIWYENPSWQMHTIIGDITRPDNVCFAPYDIDGDEKLDFALGADWTFRGQPIGTIQWLSPGNTPADEWSLHPLGAEPTVHRIRWADIDADGQAELLVLPLFGRGTTRPHYMEAGVRLLAYEIPDDPRSGDWESTVLNDELHVAHNLWPTDLNEDGKMDILVASFEGVSLLERSDDGNWVRTLLGAGNQETSPSRGASEIKDGKLADGSSYLATIEPWHGFQVVVYTPPDGDKTSELWNRHVIDDQLQWGHAVWCENLDGDPDQELIIGVRDDQDERYRRGLRIYDPAGDSPSQWQRQIVDPASVAIEDLAAGDLDGDGDTDIVAVGRQTHNVRIYWNETGR